MRFFQLGVIVVIALAALLGFVLKVTAQASGPALPVQVALIEEVPQTQIEQVPAEQEPVEVTVEASDIDAVGLVITPTVGTSSSQCATSNTVQVAAGTPVYYCFTVRHTGAAGDEPLTTHNLQSSRGLNRAIPSFNLNPGEIRQTVQAGLFITDSTNVDVTTYFTWTARPPDNEPQVFATGRAQIDVVGAGVSVVKTVGQDTANCSTTSFLTIPNNSTAVFCITIQNTGDISLTNHTINDPVMGINNATFNYNLRAGEFLRILPSNMGSLGITQGQLQRNNVTSRIDNSVTYTGRGVNNVTATGSSTATVDIGTTTAILKKTMNVVPENCQGGSIVTVPVGTIVYYCVIIQNTGAVTLTHHHLTEQYLSIDVSFDYPLAPGASLSVTNDFLARNNQPIVFGPFEIDPKFGPKNVVGDTMTYVGTGPGGVSASTSAGATVTYPPTPTITPTSGPDSTSTPTPTFPVTPSPTPIPPTPTFSPTPTFTPITPSPTPTRSYAISLLETPTPRSQVAGVPGNPSQQGFTPTPTLDPFLQGQEPPAQDPLAATATQYVVDATTTALAVEATAIQLTVESAQATAVAETQSTLPPPDSPLPSPLSPESPLPTPTADPFFDGTDEGSGLPVAPGLETATVVATDTLMLGITGETPLPGADIPADITVLPPQITAIVATETPMVVVLVVTNTPEPGSELTPLAEGQRPIDYPTPTPTPDFVMAAARTLDVAVTTMGWLWFLAGSLIFFVTAGVVAGLFFRQSEASRFDLSETDYWLEENPQAYTGRSDNPVAPSSSLSSGSSSGTKAGSSADDDWPADLP